jgi:membrane protein required for colicin V production
VTSADALAVVLTLVFALRGWLKGLVWQALRLAGLVAGLLLAARIDEPFGRFLARHFSFVPPERSDVVAWAVVVAAVYGLAAFGSHLARDLVRDARLQGPDRFFGGLVGAAFGFGLVAVALTLWASTKEPAEVERTFGGSVAARLVARATHAAAPLFPPGVRERWAPVLHVFDR